MEKNIGVKKTKVIQCIDCGEWFEIDIKDTESCRCPECYMSYRKMYKAKKEKERYLPKLEELLDSASYSLPKNNKYDLIIRFCFINKIFNLTDINELLYEYNCKLFNY